MGEIDQRAIRDQGDAMGPISGGLMNRRGMLRLSAAAGLSLGGATLLAGCGDDKPAVTAPLKPLDPDTEPDSIVYSQLKTKFGAVPSPSETYRMGVVVKFLGNEYWKLLADGMQAKAKQYGIVLDVQGASSESDTTGQLAIMQGMVKKRYDALLVSPQTDENLVAAVEQAKQAGILIINVDDAVLAEAEHFVGPNQYENGVRAAKYIISEKPGGGEVAVIEGQAGVYAAKRRTLGFKNTMAGTPFKVVASVSGDWDLQKSLEVSSTILEQHPKLKGFYCNNDIMALGTVEAVRKAGALGKIIVIGTDGIRPAYNSIRTGDLTATVDSFPFATGQVAVEVAVRILGDQDLPRVVFSPQNLVTKENINNPLPR